MNNQPFDCGEFRPVCSVSRAQRTITFHVREGFGTGHDGGRELVDPTAEQDLAERLFRIALMDLAAPEWRWDHDPHEYTMALMLRRVIGDGVGLPSVSHSGSSPGSMNDPIRG